jgi:hypothetical protein
MALAQVGDGFAVARQALIDEVVIGVDGFLQLDAAPAQSVDGGVEVVRAERDVLDAFAEIALLEFLDVVGLAVFAFALVERDANLGSRTGHRL